MNPIIEGQNLSRFYGMILGLNNVNFTIRPGITGVVGPNGAGKTTLFRLLTGQIRPSSGSLRVFGLDPWNNPAVQARLAYCPESESVPADVGGRDWLVGLGMISGLSAKDAKSRAAEKLERVKLAPQHWNKRLTALSKGMRQRVKLAQCLIHEPELVILDEPMNGLDPMGREEFGNVLRELAQEGRSVIISSHILRDLETLCADFLMLRWGRIPRSLNEATSTEARARWPEATSFRCESPEKLARPSTLRPTPPEMNAPPSPVAPSAPSFPAARVTPNVRHAFGGVWRLTVCRFLAPKHWLILAGLMGVLVLLSVPMSPNRAAAAQGFLPWVSGFYLTFLAPILAFLTAAGVMREEFKGATVDYVLTRPVARPVFLVFKFVAHLVCAQADFLCAFAVVVGIGVYHGVPGLWEAVPRLLLAQVILLTAFSAFGFLGAVLTSRYVVVGLLYGGIIEIGVGKIPTQLSRLSMTGQVKSMLAPLTRAPGVEAFTPDAGALATTAILVSFAVVVVGVAAALFAWQELASAQSRET
ncbi:MAG: ATP-binding cassette domain-containing protein [Verrucomicrobia bacterium]|nr:ATP-binding cassette domain-containing protein [Verrucomicrobiota bacterium]